MVEISVGFDKVTRSRVVAGLNRAAVELPYALDLVTRDFAYRSLAVIRRNASGRPGPNAPTGDYKRTWNPHVNVNSSITIGTNAPQARRLEYGFTGEDSLGRYYRQRAYPHLRPAVREIRPLFRAEVRKEVRRVLGTLDRP